LICEENLSSPFINEECVQVKIGQVVQNLIPICHFSIKKQMAGLAYSAVYQNHGYLILIFLIVFNKYKFAQKVIHCHRFCKANNLLSSFKTNDCWPPWI